MSLPPIPADLLHLCETEREAVRRYALQVVQALRPVAMTRDALKVLMYESGYGHVTAQEKADFINGFRHAEAHHGITAQGAQGEQA